MPRSRRARGADIAIMLYTSGTTGKPKGVMLSHDNMVHTSINGIRHDTLTENEEVLAYLPMAWVGDHLFSYSQAIVAGFTVNCPESGATVLHDLREIGPSYFFAPPRIWESILTTVMVRIEDAAAPKRAMFRAFMKVAERVGARLLDGAPVGFGDRLLYGLGNLLVYGPLKDNLGFSRIRVAYTAGEAIGPEIFSFYRSLGINIKQIYGMTEATALVCGQRDGEVDPEAVGVAMPGVELRIGGDGEVQFRSPGTFVGYFRNEEATRETRSADGWISSGDAGYFDSNGQLRIIDRAKDVGRLTDGTLFAPKYIENKLKFSQYVLEAVAHGDGRDFVCAFVNIDLEAVGNWAERHGLAYTSYTDLAGKDEVYDLIAREIGSVNAALAADETMRGAQIRRFLILHKQLDPDDNELTRTRKVRRRFVSEKYAELVAALFDGAESVRIEARVTFEDGREGYRRGDPPDTRSRAGRAGSCGGLTGVAVEKQTGGALLEVDRISLGFGAVQALSDVSVAVREREILAIIGPNGAGKTSLLNCINGVYRPQSGRIAFDGEPRGNLSPADIARQGIARTFQNVALFRGMTTLDNIMAGRNTKIAGGLFAQALYWGRYVREELRHRRAVEEIIDFLEIQAIRKTPVGRLPYGLQKRVELGRALAAEPRLLLLDEPMAGMNVEEKEDMSRFVLDVNDEFGTTIVLIEHDMGVVMDISDRIAVLDYGRKIAEGAPEEVRRNPAVIDAYLGVGA